MIISDMVYHFMYSFLTSPHDKAGVTYRLIHCVVAPSQTHNQIPPVPHLAPIPPPTSASGGHAGREAARPPFRHTPPSTKAMVTQSPFVTLPPPSVCTTLFHKKRRNRRSTHSEQPSMELKTAWTKQRFCLPLLRPLFTIQPGKNRERWECLSLGTGPSFAGPLRSGHQQQLLCCTLWGVCLACPLLRWYRNNRLVSIHSHTDRPLPDLRRPQRWCIEVEES